MKPIKQSILFFRIIYYPINILYNIAYKFLFRKKYNILSTGETVDRILANHVSISRFGDGEMRLIRGGGINFQKYDETLSNKLREVLLSNDKNTLVCVMYIISGDVSMLRKITKTFWQYNMLRNRRKWEEFLQEDKVYGDSLFTRFYIEMKDKSKCGDVIRKVQKIWENKDLLIIEGKESRLGVGNDLFANCRSISRILCPPESSFDYYQEILKKAELYANDKLILLALGPTATVLAYELSQKGYWAIDIGHIDIEYEWYLKGATQKTPIKGKYVDDCHTRGEDIANKDYESQIIEIIG